jgi:hypothetical protein
MGGATDGLWRGVLKAFEAKVEIPGQEALLPLLHPGCDGKARLVQCLEHVREDAFDGWQALNVVERIHKPGMRSIVQTHGRHAVRCQVFKKCDQLFQAR